MNLLACIIIRAHGIIFRNRATKKIQVDQALFIDPFVENVMLEAAERGTSVGKILYLRLPEPAANIATNKYFDPYFQHLTKVTLWNWLENHVLFDKDGQIVVLHDRGIILWKETNNG